MERTVLTGAYPHKFTLDFFVDPQPFKRIITRRQGLFWISHSDLAILAGVYAGVGLTISDPSSRSRLGERW